MVLQIMVFGFLKTQTLVLQVIVMLIGQAMLMIEKVHLVDVFTLVITWFLGSVRNRTQFLCLLQKLSTLLQEAVAHSYFG